MSVNPNSAVIYFNYYAFHHKNNLLFPYIKLQLFSAGIHCCLGVMPLSDLTKIQHSAITVGAVYVQAYNSAVCLSTLLFSESRFSLKEACNISASFLPSTECL